MYFVIEYRRDTGRGPNAKYTMVGNNVRPRDRAYTIRGLDPASRYHIKVSKRFFLIQFFVQNYVVRCLVPIAYPIFPLFHRSLLITRQDHQLLNILLQHLHLKVIISLHPSVVPLTGVRNMRSGIIRIMIVPTPHQILTQ